MLQTPPNTTTINSKLHSLLVMQLSKATLPSLFRFLASWASYIGFKQLVASTWALNCPLTDKVEMISPIQTWNSKVFGIIGKIRHLVYACFGNSEGTWKSPLIPILNRSRAWSQGAMWKHLLSWRDPLAPKFFFHMGKR